MTILDKVKEYYHANSLDLNSFLGATSFMDVNSKYPNSVVIKFGTTKLIGEVSVWQNGTETYIEFEYANLTKADNEPVIAVKNITEETIIDVLTMHFEALRKLDSKNNL